MHIYSFSNKMFSFIYFFLVPFIIQIKYIFSTNIPLFIAFQLSIYIPLTVINKGILINNTYFVIKIDTINHLFFLK